MTPEEIIDTLENVEVLEGPFEGGQKKVYKCKINNKINALKFIRSSKAGDAGEIRCVREIETLKACNSDFLIKIGEIPYFEQSIDDGHLIYYSEEWIDGYTLYKPLEEKNLFDEKQIMKMAREMSYAIEELWKHNKVHRDIKPMNIMYDEINDRYVLLDLGMIFDSTEVSLTKYGYLVGTKGYYSPEQFDLSRKADLDFRSDLFCLGIVMYQLLTGKHPFIDSGDDNDLIFYKIRKITPTKISNYRKDISPKLEGTIFRLLRKRPSERFRSCEIFRKFLER